MNKTLFRKFISWFWGIIYLLPLAFIILELFRNGFDFTYQVSNIETFLSNFNIPFFSDIVDDLIQLLNASNNLGTYILIYMSSWFLFVTVIKFFVLMFYYLISILEEIIFKFSERVCK